MRIRAAFWLLTAVVACAAMASAASAAEPAFYECAKLKGGAFGNKTCSEAAMPGKGKFELAEGIGSKHAFSSKIETFRMDVGELEITCEKSRLSGEFTSTTSLGNVHIELANCNEGECGEKVVHHVGVIEVGPLAGPIGYVSKETHEVAVNLAPESGTTLAEFNCAKAGPPAYRLKGSLFAKFETGVNAFTKTPKLKATGNGAFEGGGPNPLQLETIEAATVEDITVSTSTWLLRDKSLLEIKA